MDRNDITLIYGVIEWNINVRKIACSALGHSFRGELA